MNRKNYQTPSMLIVEIHSPQHLLAGNSPGEGPAQAHEFDFDTFE